MIVPNLSPSMVLSYVAFLQMSLALTDLHVRISLQRMECFLWSSHQMTV